MCPTCPTCCFYLRACDLHASTFLTAQSHLPSVLPFSFLPTSWSHLASHVLSPTCHLSKHLLFPPSSCLSSPHDPFCFYLLPPLHLPGTSLALHLLTPLLLLLHYSPGELQPTLQIAASAWPHRGLSPLQPQQHLRSHVITLPLQHGRSPRLKAECSCESFWKPNGMKPRVPLPFRTFASAT